MITQQAQIIAYIDDYKLLMIATLVVIPLLIVFQRTSGGNGEDHTLSDGMTTGNPAPIRTAIERTATVEAPCHLRAEDNPWHQQHRPDAWLARR